MENPVTEIPTIVRSLTQSSPSKQQRTIETYFAPNASFTHPFCRTGSWELGKDVNSRFLILAIYRWYKIMSPRIDLSVNSIAYDATTLTLYLTITQTFRIWIIPFYAASVTLVTVLKLSRSESSRKYLIQSQEDLYQTNEFVRFFWFGGFIFVWLWQFGATAICGLGALLLAPLMWAEGAFAGKGWKRIASRDDNGKSKGEVGFRKKEDEQISEFQREMLEMAVLGH